MIALKLQAGCRRPHMRSENQRTSLSIREAITTASLISLRPDWEELSADAETASPFNSWTWLANWWQVFGGGYHLRIFVVRDGTRIIAIAPFYTMVFRLGPLRLRMLVPLGYGNDLTERLEILVARGWRAEAIACLSNHLVRRRKNLFDVMLWHGVLRDELSPQLRHLVRPASDTSYELRHLPGSWNMFVTGLNKSMRDNIKYYPRLLARHGHLMRVQIASSPEEMGSAIAEFLRLHHARAALTGTARHDDRFALPSHQQFLSRVAPALAEAGVMRLTILTVDSVNVAAQISLHCGGTVYIYYSGFDPAWRQYSVAMIATAQCIRDALERGASHVDFLGGSGQFKERWDTTRITQGKVILLRDAQYLTAAFAVYKLLHYLIIERLSLRPHRGLSPRARLLRWINALLRQSST
jgi:CelD/BcsL family acetyltransferase involved in cellulose biosynthesis